MILSIEAAGVMAGGASGNERAIQLLRVALAEMEGVVA
jgi:hypothetical protein